jgi:outer membrane protein OmpA-like peptidoglycan-associated protein
LPAVLVGTVPAGLLVDDEDMPASSLLPQFMVNEVAPLTTGTFVYMLKKIAIVALCATYLSACTTTDPYTGEQKVSNTAGGIGSYMDNQEAELRAQLQGTGVSVTRVGDRIILNMPSNITFATDQDQVIPPFYRTLDSVAIVLNKFNKTLIDVNGHTDSTGSLQHNQALSERRAASVANYLGSRSVDQRRMSTMGFGPSQPVASNATSDGRAQNRRVEVAIAPITQG